MLSASQQQDTYHIDPRPPTLHVVIMLRINNESHSRDSNKAPNIYCEDSLADSGPNSAPSRLIEAPDCGEELGDRNDAEDHCVASKRNIVELHSRRETMMSQCVLLAYVRRV
jgi:hypothetical protein